MIIDNQSQSRDSQENAKNIRQIQISQFDGNLIVFENNIVIWSTYDP